MPTPPHRLQPDTPLADNLALISDNFDKVVQDIGDLGAKFTGTVSYSVTLAANGVDITTIGVADSTHIYKAGQLQIVVRPEVWVDTNGNDNYLWGYVNSLTAGQSNLSVAVLQQRRASTGNVADFTVQLRNFDVAAHTYYVTVDVGYTASPPTGVFR